MKKTDGVGVRAHGIVDRSFDFAVCIIKLCLYLDERSGVGRLVMPQIIRSGTSIVSNVEEAPAGQSWADFISKMSIALKKRGKRTFDCACLGLPSWLLPSDLTPISKSRTKSCAYWVQ